MEITLYDRLRPYLAPLLSAFIVPFFTWLAGKTNIPLFRDPGFQAVMRDVAVAWVMLILVKTGLNKYINPGNTASAHLAKSHATEAAELKES